VNFGAQQHQTSSTRLLIFFVTLLEHSLKNENEALSQVPLAKLAPHPHDRIFFTSNYFFYYYLFLSFLSQSMNIDEDANKYIWKARLDCDCES
jgi:hypothetical protein